VNTSTASFVAILGQMTEFSHLPNLVFAKTTTLQSATAS